MSDFLPRVLLTPWGVLIAQVTACLAAGLIASLVYRRRPSRAHLLLLCGLAAAMVLPGAARGARLAGWGWLPSPTPQTPSAAVAAPAAAPLALPAVPPALPDLVVGDAVPPPRAEPRFQLPTRSVLFGGWAVLSVLTAVWYARAYAAAWRIARRATPVADADWLALAREALPTVDLRTTSELAAPSVWCWSRRPVLLVPTTARADDGADWRGVFRHEAAHCRRRDHYTTLATHFLVALLPWHPLAHGTARRLRFLAEAACDDWALVEGHSATAYADTLCRMALRPTAGAALAAASSRRALRRRVLRIAEGQAARPLVGRTWSAGAALLTAACVAAVALAQPGAQVEADSTKGTATIDVEVVDEQGTPIPEAIVVLQGWRWSLANRDKDDAAQAVVLAHGTSDGSGKVQLTTKGSPDPWLNTYVMAFAQGHGASLAAVGITGGQQVRLKLGAEQPVTLQLVQGATQEPVTNVVPKLAGIEFVRQGMGQPIWVTDELRALVPALKLAETARAGTFQLKGCPLGPHVSLQIDDPRFAPQSFGLWVQPHPETPRLEIGVGREVKGRVVDAETGQPVADAQVQLDAQRTDRAQLALWLEQYSLPPGVPPHAESVHTTTHARGAFSARILLDQDLTAHVGVPDSDYLRKAEYFQVSKGAPLPEIVVKLRRGAVVSGVVTEQPSGQPVARALVRVGSSTEPESHNGPSTYTDDQGRYRLAVPPGQHHLLVLGPTGDYVSQIVGSKELRNGRPGGLRLRPDAYKKVDVPQAGAEVSFELKRGRTIRGRLVGPNGEPVTHAIVVNPIYHYPYQETLAAQMATCNGPFEIHGCDPDQTYRVSFLDPQHHWGATVDLSGQQEAPVTVRLEPCASGVVHYLTHERAPAGKQGMFPLELVINEGELDFAEGVDKGTFSADTAFIANIDRENLWDAKTDAKGRLEFSLIPGAKYCGYNFVEGKRPERDKPFTPQPGERIDFGEIILPPPQAEGLQQTPPAAGLHDAKP